MMARLWRLERFQDAIERWRDLDGPPPEQVARAARWIGDVLASDPFLPGAHRMPEGLEEFDITHWRIPLPFAGPGRVLELGYRIDVENRVITCLILGEVEGTFPG